MNLRRFASPLALASLLTAATLLASDWTSYSSDSYGFKMLVPTGTAVKTREWKGGWGGIYAEHDGVRLYGIAKLGTKASAEEVEKYAVETLGVTASGWKQIDAGKGSNGWEWYRTFEAVKGSQLLFGGYGVGPKGTYLLYLETTVADYQEHKDDYRKWYHSITLN